VSEGWRTWWPWRGDVWASSHGVGSRRWGDAIMGGRRARDANCWYVRARKCKFLRLDVGVRGGVGPISHLGGGSTSGLSEGVRLEH
jgi:hypothetical protein